MGRDQVTNIFVPLCTVDSPRVLRFSLAVNWNPGCISRTMGIMGRKKRKTGRPYGIGLTKDIRVRLLPETREALLQAKKLFNISASEIVRAVVEHAIVDSVPKAVQLINDPKTCDTQKLRFLKYLRLCAKSDIAVHNPASAQRLGENTATR